MALLQTDFSSYLPEVVYFLNNLVHFNLEYVFLSEEKSIFLLGLFL